MKKNHLEFHQSLQKENRLKALAIRETFKVIVKMILKTQKSKYLATIKKCNK